PEHSFVAAACEKTIRLLEPSTGRDLGSFNHPNPEAANSHPLVVLASGATNLLAAHRAEGVISLWDLASRKLITTFQPFTNNVNVLALSPNGNYLVAADQDPLHWYSSALSLWDIFSRPDAPRLVWSDSTTNAILAATFSPDGQVLVIVTDLGDEIVIDGWEV